MAKIVYVDGDRTIGVTGKILSEDELFYELEREDRIQKIAKKSIVSVEIHKGE